MWRRHDARGWRRLRYVCWWSLIVLVPAFVVEIKYLNTDLYC